MKAPRIRGPEVGVGPTDARRWLALVEHLRRKARVNAHEWRVLLAAEPELVELLDAFEALRLLDREHQEIARLAGRIGGSGAPLSDGPVTLADAWPTPEVATMLDIHPRTVLDVAARRRWVPVRVGRPNWWARTDVLAEVARRNGS